MIDAQAKRLAEMQNNEEARVEGEVKKKEENDERKRLEKLEMMQRWEEDIQKSRQAQIQRKQNARAKEKAEDAETAKFLAEWCKVLDKQEQEENRLKDEAAKKLAEDHSELNRMAQGTVRISAAQFLTHQSNNNGAGIC
ncbi:unnamed protein product [Durusdinium trenchii]|uniref:Trichohyalin-plectin-homology domain-containing protein n=2 Tax=Durusdinium trenchii TaxID=1381693 RepID=A0ABP0L693_9DINO